MTGWRGRHPPNAAHATPVQQQTAHGPGAIAPGPLSRPPTVDTRSATVPPAGRQSAAEPTTSGAAGWQDRPTPPHPHTPTGATHIVANPPTKMDPGGGAQSSGASPQAAGAESSDISAAVISALSADSSSDPPTAADASSRVAAMVRDVHDYPTPGIVFKDITPLLADARLFASVVAALADPFRGAVDVVAGIEARGFILGAPVALALGAGFVPLRKAGKLPRQTLSESYDLEYDSATLEMHEDAVHPGQRVLLVDDVIATGGTAEAATRLVSRAGGSVSGVTALIELPMLGGRSRLGAIPIHVIYIV